MNLSEFKVIFYWEYVHRMLARLIGLFFLIPLIYFYFTKQIKKEYIYICILIFFFILFQGVIGWYMVSSGLFERVDVSHFRLSIHLLIAFLILSLILWNYLKLRNEKIISNKINSIIPFSFLILIFTQKVVMHMRRPKCTAYMWSSGKMVCTGSNSAENANRAAKRFVRRLRRIGFPVSCIAEIN